MRKRYGTAAAALCGWAWSLWAAPEREGWVNVRDLGASGSAFEATASTTAGSKQILVRNVGDFRVGQQVMISKCHVHYEDCRLRGPGSPYREWKRLSGTGQDTPSSQTTETTS